MTGTNDAAQTSSIRAVNRAFDIVELLAAENALTLSEIAEEMEMPVSTVYGYLHTLREIGYVLKTGDEYVPSSQFVYVGNQVKRTIPVYRISYPELRKLAEQTGEYVTLMVREGEYGIILEQDRGEEVKHVGIQETHPGVRTYLHITAPAKILLAFATNIEDVSYLREEPFPSWTRNTITERDELESRVAEIRDQGYAEDIEETMIGMQGVAAPIYDEQNNTFAAVSVYGPTRRMEEKMATVRSHVLETANMIELELNYS